MLSSLHDGLHVGKTYEAVELFLRDEGDVKQWMLDGNAGPRGCMARASALHQGQQITISS